jgi:hypothetical protein
MNPKIDQFPDAVPASLANTPPGSLTRWWRNRAGVGALVWKVALCAALAAGVVALGGFALYLAAMRIYQVDEACNIRVAQLAAMGKPVGFDLFQILLSRVLPRDGASAEIFASARVLMVVIFWVNWILLAAATGERLFSRRWWLALAGAATLAPLWDFGIEARHDNLLLSGILLMWGAVRFRPLSLAGCVLLGFGVVVLQFLTIKAFVYTVPISFLFLAWPPPGAMLPRWKMILAWVGGMVAAFLAVRFFYHLCGVGENYLANVRGVASVSGLTTRFWPWEITLPRLLTQTPLVLSLAVAAILTNASGLLRAKRSALNWEGSLPEVCLFGVALVAMFINPNPYPYNLLHLVPYAFLLAFRHATLLWQSASERAVTFYPVMGAVVIFAHLVPFGVATRRHLEWPNSRQELVMSLAERLTDPQRDSVFDGIGMVPSRLVLDSRAFIHGQMAQRLQGDRFREWLAANPAAVVIPNYRTDYLSPANHAYIREHYVAVSDDFWVLGKILPEGGGTFEVIHPGRYRISTLQTSDLMGTYPEGLKGLLAPEEVGRVPGTLDGLPIPDQPIELTRGTHRIESTVGCQPAVVWLGPHADRLHRQGTADHTRLFNNWY